MAATKPDLGNAPRSVLLAGGSGLVGGHLARCISAELAGDGTLWLPLRRPMPGLMQLPGVRPLSWPLPEPLPAIDAAVCALGTTLAVAGSREAFRAVDLEAVLSVALAARRVGARRFGLVSAMGADPASRVFYNRVKGEAEAAVAALGFECLVIAQPSLLLGERQSLGQPRRPGESLAQRVSPWLGHWVPLRWRPIAAERVAHALWSALKKAPPGVTRLRSDALAR